MVDWSHVSNRFTSVFGQRNAFEWSAGRRVSRLLCRCRAETVPRDDAAARSQPHVVVGGRTFRRFARVVRHGDDGFALEFEDAGAQTDKELAELLSDMGADV